MLDTIDTFLDRDWLLFDNDHSPIYYHLDCLVWMRLLVEYGAMVALGVGRM